MTREQEEEVKRLFGQSLRIILAKNNKSQSWLSRQTGLDRTYISRLYNGIRLPSIGAIKMVCDVFGVSISEFVNGGEE